ncbi:MAG: hypothetical protein WA912_10580, partial [Ornithinimicrobium sp.]
MLTQYPEAWGARGAVERDQTSIREELESSAGQLLAGLSDGDVSGEAVGRAEVGTDRDDLLGLVLRQRAEGVGVPSEVRLGHGHDLRAGGPGGGLGSAGTGAVVPP